MPKLQLHKNKGETIVFKNYLLVFPSKLYVTISFVSYFFICIRSF